MVQEVDKAILRQNIGRKQQFGRIFHRAEAALQDGVGMTPCHQKYGKLLGDLRIVVEQFQKVALRSLLHRWEKSLTGLVHYLRSARRVSVCTYRFAESVLLQDANSYETIEPSVGSLLVHLVHTFVLHLFIKAHPLVVKTFGEGMPIPKRAALQELRS